MAEFKPRGVYAALPTPIAEDGSVNYEASRNHIDYLEEGGVHGIVPAGCTGHAATLGDRGESEYDEHVEHIFRISGMTDLPVIAGDGINSTEQTIELATRIEEEADIDAHLIISPYQNGPPQDQIVSHYRQIAEELDENIIAYNVPGRTGRNIEPRTLESIAEIPGVVGIKEASNDPDQIKEMGERLRDYEDFYLGSGDDARNDLVFREGGTFGIGVSVNVYPEAATDVWEAAVKREDYDAAEELNRELDRLHDAMFQEGEKNPISVHYALNELGFDFGTPRAPLDREPLEGYEPVHGEIFTNQTEIKHVLDHFDLAGE